MTISPEQKLVSPTIALGCARPELGATDKVCGLELNPQLLLAVTLIIPAVEPTLEMLVVVEDPVHPFGKVQVYELAPLTGEIEYDTDSPRQ